jgi:hypothetical protein
MIIPERAPRELEVAGSYNAIPIGPSAMKALHACLSTRDSICQCMARHTLEAHLGGGTSSI